MPTQRRTRRSAAVLASAIAAGCISTLGLAPATAAESTTYLTSLTWLSATNGYGPAERDRSNGEAGSGDGRTLTLQGRTFARGLGVHSASGVTYAVPAGCTRFNSVIGIDDEVGGNGSAVFTVFDGGKQVYASTVRRGGSPNLDVSVPVTPGGRLRLVVADGGDNSHYDHANWADARFTCTSPTTPSAPPTSSSDWLVNGGADVDTSGWASVNASLTRSTDIVRSGAGSFRLTTAGNGHVLLVAQPVTAGLTPGTTLSVTAWVRSSSVSRSALLQTDWSSSTGYLSTSGTPTQRTTTTGWTQLTATMTVPTAAVRAQFYVKFIDAVAGEVHHVDDVSVVRPAAAPSPSTSPTPSTAPSPTAAPATPAPTTSAPTTPAPTAPAPTAPAPTTPPPTAPSTGPTGQAGTWQTIFNDDFDGTTLDAAKWSDREAWQEGGYVDSASWNPSPHTAQQIEVGGGHAALKARRGTGLPQGKGFTSGYINTRGKFAIPAGVTSYTEARLKAPSAKGLLPGFWLLGNGDSSTGQGWPITGEIDILEFANNNVGEAGSPFWSLWYPKDVYTNAPGTWMNATHVYHADSYRKRFDLYDSYHTWGLYRSPEKMELYIDGVKIATYRPNEVHNDNIPLPPMLFTGSQHLRISLIVGGWGGTGFTEAQYEEGDLGVDYVKVWRQTSP